MELRPMTCSSVKICSKSDEKGVRGHPSLCGDGETRWTGTLSIATGLCELQLELRCSSGTEDLQLRTPPIREHKRKLSKNQNVRVKLEIKFTESEWLEDPRVETVEDARVCDNTETIRHLKQCCKIASTMKSVHMDLDKICGKYVPFQFLAYWFDLWGFYD